MPQTDFILFTDDPQAGFFERRQLGSRLVLPQANVGVDAALRITFGIRRDPAATRRWGKIWNRPRAVRPRPGRVFRGGEPVGAETPAKRFPPSTMQTGNANVRRQMWLALAL